MAVQKINIDEFLKIADTLPIFDVRSPSEFAHAHIPGAYSLPIFSDEERKVIGTSYKQESRTKAIKIGLDYFGPKMRTIVENVEAHLCSLPKTNAANNTILVHCWRGGMRSAAMAWLLDLYGYKVYTLIGGYKAYRTWALTAFNEAYSFQLLGGYTGSGKTEVLTRLAAIGEYVIDLEAIAHHKGSAFGGWQQQQPSQEMFENELALLLYKAKIGGKSVWLEDESQRIGTLNIPHPIWKQMRAAKLYFLNLPFEMRLQYILNGYGNISQEYLINAIVRIKKRLGGLDTKNAINYIVENDLDKAFAILLKYYDKQYLAGLNKRENLNELLCNVVCANADAAVNADSIMKFKNNGA